MLSFKSKRERKNMAVAVNRNRRQALWREDSSPDTRSRFECLLEERTRRRSQVTWCRVCLSSDCCLDQRHHSSPEEYTDVDDNDFSEKLKSIKQRRIAVRNYADHLGKLSSIYSLGVLHQPYLPTKKYLPPWLTEVLHRELHIPVVPTFPASERALSELVSGLDLNEGHKTLLQDYRTAASYIRRVRIGVASDKNSQLRPAFMSIPTLFACEEISDGTVQPSLQAENDHSRCRNTDSLAELSGPVSASLNVPSNETAPLVKLRPSPARTIEAVSQVDELQLVGRCLIWNTLYTCPTVTVTECREERVLITGTFSTGTYGDLHFKLLLFPGERTDVASMRMKGIYLRDSEQSKYRLRWKYDLDIPATPTQGQE